MQTTKYMRDIDGVWASYGLSRYVGAPWSYVAITLILLTPLAAVIIFILCYLAEDDEYDDDDEDGTQEEVGSEENDDAFADPADGSQQKVKPGAKKKTHSKKAVK